MRGSTQIADPARFVTASADSLTAFYTELRRILTEAARENTSFLGEEGNEKFKSKLRELLEKEAEGFGLIVASLDVWEVFPLYQQQTEEGDLPSLPLQ
jgi:hypothetical protein